MVAIPLGRVLIVDPHHAIRRGVRVLIDDLDYCKVVAEAADGREALQVLPEARPTLAILGLSLPHLNGFELAHKIRCQSPRTQILVYSDKTGERAILDALRAGARGYVLKSDPASKLVAAIEALSMNKTYFSDAVSEVLLHRLLKSKLDDLDDDLSHREREIVQLVAEGRINKQIGCDLDISVKTVESHRASAMRKLSTRTTADLVRYAIRNGIVQA